jgi:hypothetical protein
VRAILLALGIASCARPVVAVQPVRLEATLYCASARTLGGDALLCTSWDRLCVWAQERASKSTKVLAVTSCDQARVTVTTTQE